MIEDLLYEPVKIEGAKRTQTDKINDNVEVVYEVTTTNGQDHYEIKSVTVTSTSIMTITVDNKIIVQPPQPTYTDDCCYFKLSDPIEAVKKTKPAWGIVRNEWIPSDLGYVGYRR
jgi:hypothetical protein